MREIERQENERVNERKKGFRSKKNTSHEAKITMNQPTIKMAEVFIDDKKSC